MPPLLRVTLFGALDIRDQHDASVEVVLTQPKRAALFAYLAATQQRGFRRRDSILALFWPELSERRARDALNSALYFLRRSLGDGVIVGRGGDEIGLAPGEVWCDVVAFDSALQAGDDEAATALARGELLDGLLVSDAPEFDDWLSRERERVRSGARDAATRLSAGSRTGGDLAASVKWARRALEIAPDDEGALRNLLLACEADGDVAGALRQYESFALHLGRSFGLEPTSETVALATAIRERHHRAAGPSPHATAGDRSASPAGTAPPDDFTSAPNAPTDARPSTPATGSARAVSGKPVGRSGSLRAAADAPRVADSLLGALLTRKVALVGVVVAFLVVVAAGVGALVRAPGSEAGDPERREAKYALAVFPFDYHGSEGNLFLGEGVARLLGTSFDGIPDLRVIDSRALLGASRGADSTLLGSIAPAIALRDARATDATDGEGRWRTLAGSLRATMFVSGEIDASGDSLDVRATLQESVSGGRVLARARVRAGKDELFGVVDQLALQLMAALPSSPGARIERVAARTTQSLPALKRYLEGEGEFRRGRFAEAIEAFRGAVAADSTFALALFRLSNALTWSRLAQEPPPDSLAQAAIRHGAGLPERDRILLRAWLSYLHGDAVDAEQRYREVLSSRPDDVEANFYLGEVLFHWGPLFGRPSVEAIAPFEHVLEFEPENAGALSHLVRLAATAGDEAKVRRYAAELMRLNPDPAEVTDVRTLEAFATHDSAAMRTFEDSLPHQSSRDARRLIWTLAAHTHDADAIARLLARLGDPPVEPFARRQARIALALQLMAQGRPNAASAALGPNDVITTSRSIEYRAMLATLPFVTTPPATLASIERALLATEPRAMRVGPGQYSLPTDSIYPPRRLFLLGLLRLRLQDPGGAARYADSLATIGWENNRNRLFSRSFGKQLRAELLARDGHPGEALAALGLPGVEEDSNLTELTSYPKAHERWLRAELLRRLGRPREAKRWYETFPDLQLSDLMYRTIAELRSAELAEASGQRAAAVDGYRRAALAWRNAEPAFVPLRREALEGLRRVGGVAPTPEVDASPHDP